MPEQVPAGAGGPAWSAGPRAVPLLLLGAALLLLPALGAYGLFDVDEGAFSEATREMLASGDWWSTTLNGAPRYDKPILIYWLQALSAGGLGISEFSLRLPSALAGLAWVGLVAAFARPRFGAWAGWLAGWVCATSLGVMAMSRAATADALLNALLVATLFDLWRALESADRAALRRAYLWVALGVLTKGPIAILIPGATILLWCLLERRWRELARAATDLPGWAIFLAVAAPWYVLQWNLHGREFVEGFLVRHNLQRFGGPLEGHGGGLFYYVLLLPLLVLPWTGLLWGAARAARADFARAGEPLARFLWIWFGFVLVFFSLSGTKLPHYALYGATPLFLLVARRAAGSAPGPWAFLPALFLCVFFALAPGLVDAWALRLAAPSERFYADQARDALALAPLAYYLLCGGAGVAVLVLAFGPRRTAAARLAAAAGLAAAAFGFAFVPWLGALLNGPVREAGLAAARRPEAAVTWNFTAPSFSLYRGAPTPARPPAPGEIALARTDKFVPTPEFEVLLRRGGVLLVRRRQP